MKRIIILTFLLLCTISIFAQVTFQPKQLDFQNEGVIFDKEFTLDFRFLQTNGYSLGLNFGRIKTYYRTTFYHFDFGELKHIRQYKQEGFNSPNVPGFGGNNSFIFGKRNTFLVLRGGYGQKRYFSEKAKKQGLAVGISYEAGPTLGLLKPYYLDLEYTIEDGRTVTIRSEKYGNENHDVFLDQSRIRGASGFTKGLGEISIVPGIHLQGSAHFDWGAFDEFVKAVEAGIMVDVFFQKVPIMVEVDGVENQPVFINLFINLQLGKRS